MKTKKVAQAGKYGARYGVGIRRRLLKVERVQREKQTCPFCGFKKVKRLSPGIFRCKKCDKTFTGGAYITETATGKLMKSVISQKGIKPELLEELEEKITAEVEELNLEDIKKQEEKKEKENKEPKSQIGKKTITPKTKKEG